MWGWLAVSKSLADRQVLVAHLVLGADQPSSDGEGVDDLAGCGHRAVADDLAEDAVDWKEPPGVPALQPDLGRGRIQDQVSVPCPASALVLAGPECSCFRKALQTPKGYERQVTPSQSAITNRQSSVRKLQFCEFALHWASGRFHSSRQCGGSIPRQD